MTAQTEQAKAIAAAPDVKPHASINAALVAALSDLSVVEPKRTANLGTYSYKYADIADVVKLTRPVLHAHGLVALTPVHDHGAGLACTVTILHESGERLDFGPFPFPHGRDAQATGSAVTYHRRYALVAALGMAAGDDDDGAAAKPAPKAWNKAQAKAHVLHLADGVADLAKQAWEAFGESTPFTAEDIEVAWELWVNEPADGPAPPVEGEGAS